MELSDNRVSDNNLTSELVGNRSSFKLITIEEIVIFMIKHFITCAKGFPKLQVAIDNQ